MFFIFQHFIYQCFEPNTNVKQYKLENKIFSISYNELSYIQHSILTYPKHN